METFNRFTIWGCGDNTGPLIRAIVDMSREAQFAMDDVEQGTTSIHGYTAFFKRNEYKTFIKELFNMIFQGLPAIAVGPAELLEQTTAERTTRVMPSPQLVCANARTSQAFGIPFDIVEHCERLLERSVFVVQQSAYVIICPAFWNQRVIPELNRNRCPIVVDNQFYGQTFTMRNGVEKSLEAERLIGLRRYALMHELVFYYLQRESLTMNSNPPETFDWNHCVELSAENSWRNPENWVLYAASKSRERPCKSGPNTMF